MHLQCGPVFFLLLFLTPTICRRHLWDVSLMHGRELSCSLVHLLKFLSCPFLEWSRVSYEGDSLGICLWWDFCYIIWFRIVFLFSWDILSKFFLSSLLAWWCLLPIFPSIYNVPFSERFDFFLIWQFYSFRHLSFSIFNTCMAHFSLPNSIPISSLYILTACIKVSNSF